MGDVEAYLESLIAGKASESVDAAACWSSYPEFCKHVTTESVDDDGKILPFPDFDTYPHVAKLADFVAVPDGERRRGLLLKSRRMFASTHFCTCFLWRALATHKSAGDVYSACIISQTEKHAKSLVRRVLGIYDRLPQWMRDMRPLAKRTETLIIVDDGGEIHGLHAGGEGPRTEGYVDGLMDELAFQENAASNWRALLACCRNVYGVSTPNGPGNMYHSLWHGLIPGTEGISKLSLHYSEHPRRAPGSPEGVMWRKQAAVGVPTVDWMREQEMRFDIFAEDGILTADWDPACRIATAPWAQAQIVDLSWDPGFDRGACVVMFENKLRQWIGLKIYLAIEENTDDFAYRVCQDIQAHCAHNPTYRMTGDPASKQRQHLKTALNENTDQQVIERIATEVLAGGTYKIRMDFDKIEVVPTQQARPMGHRMIRRMFKLRGDNRPGLLLPEDGCALLIESIEGGYRFPRRRDECSPDDLQYERPNRTSDHVHVVDAFRYLIMQRTERGSLPIHEESQPAVDYQRIARMRERALAHRIARGTA